MSLLSSVARRATFSGGRRDEEDPDKYLLNWIRAFCQSLAAFARPAPGLSVESRLDHSWPQEKGGMASYPGIKATLVTGDVIGKIKAGKVRPHPVPPSHRARRPASAPNLIIRTTDPLPSRRRTTGGDRRGRDEGAPVSRRALLERAPR